MIMNSRLMIFVGLSCVLSFGVALWAFMAGAGLLVAFLLYSMLGSVMVMAMSGVAYATMPDERVVEPSRSELFQWQLAAGQAEAQQLRAATEHGYVS